MRVYSPNLFAKKWKDGELEWYSSLIVKIPVVIQCPHCTKEIILTDTKEDKKQRNQTCLIASDFFLFIPEDMPDQLLEDFLELYHQHIKKQRAKKRQESQQQTESGVEAPSSPPKIKEATD